MYDSITLVYTDEGPKGACAQSAYAMAPHVEVHVFPDMDLMRTFVEEHYRTVSNSRKRPNIRHFEGEPEFH